LEKGVQEFEEFKELQEDGPHFEVISNQ